MLYLENYEPLVQEAGLNTLKAVDFSGSPSVALSAVTAASLAVTGAVTASGAFVGGVQTLAAAGAVNLTTLTTRIDSVGAIALTLADGTNGQIKNIVMGTDGGDATLTPTTKTGYSTIVFNDAGDGVTLVFITTKGWIVTGNNGATIS